MILFVCRILWDLGVPQAAATLLYEDNNACIAMANIQNQHHKPDIWIFNTMLSVNG
jgi:hypothetical protein